MLKQIGFSALALLVGNGLAVTATANAAAQPAHDKVTSSQVAGSQHEFVSLLSGGPKWLVYEESNKAPTYTTSSVKGVRLLARSKAGKVEQLPLTVQGYLWSLSGNWLVATPPSASSTSSKVLWWNLATHKNGHLTLPGEQSLLTAAPGGATYMTRNGVVHEKTTTGTTKRLGRPFSVEPKDYYHEDEGAGNIVGSEFTSADGQGMVLGGHGNARYLRFNAKHTITKLQTVGSHDQLCASVSHQYAACTNTPLDDDGRPDGDTSALVPLDGSKPTDTDLGGFFSGPVVAEQHMIWLGGTDRSLGPDRTINRSLESITPGSTTATKGSVGSHPQFYNLVGAYGRAITVSGTKVQSATDALHVHTLFDLA